VLRRTVAATLVAISVAAACGDAPALVGEWEATSENAEGSSFVFREDGTALWLLPDTFRIRYETDLDASPRALDLSGFEEGPLRGYMLYCIFDLEGDDTMRLDCEPGVATERGTGIRPDEFGGEQTQIFARRGGGGS
jgi:hypothetical protein